MFVYVVRPAGFKYEMCANGTKIEDGSGLCMTYSANVTMDLLNLSSNILADLDSNILDSESSSQTKSPLDGKDNKISYIMIQEIYRKRRSKIDTYVNILIVFPKRCY